MSVPQCTLRSPSTKRLFAGRNCVGRRRLAWLVEVQCDADQDPVSEVKRREKQEHGGEREREPTAGKTIGALLLGHTRRVYRHQLARHWPGPACGKAP